MNTTIRRIAITAPIAVALVGLGTSAANAAPYQPELSDTVQVQSSDSKPEVAQVPGWSLNPGFGDLDDLGDAPDDPVDPDPEGPDDVAPAPEDSDGDSDDDSDDHPGSGNTDAAPSGAPGGSSSPKADVTHEPNADRSAGADTTEAVDVAEITEVDKPFPTGPFPTGVVALTIGGLLLGLAAWASYRGDRTRV